MGLLGAFYAQLIAAVVSMVISVYLIKDWLGAFRFFEWSRLRAMIYYSLPFVPGSVAFWLVNLSGVFFVNSYLSESEAGLYQIGVSIAAVAGLVTNAFQQAWSPFAFSIINQPDAREVYAKVLQLYILLVGSFCMLVSLFAPEALVILTSPKYYEAAWVASILAFSYLTMGLTNIADLGMAIAKKTAALGFISIVSAVMLVLLNISLIPFLGKEGAALSICLSQLIVPVYMFYRSQKEYPIPYNFKRVIFTAMFFIVLTIAGRMINTGHIYYNFLIKISVILGTVVFFYRTNKSQVDFVAARLRKRKMNESV